MAEGMKATLKTAKKMEKGPSTGLVVKCILEVGDKENSMALEYCMTLRLKKKSMESGLTGKDRDGLEYMK
jgi:hypothetical protein